MGKKKTSKIDSAKQAAKEAKQAAEKVEWKEISRGFRYGSKLNDTEQQIVNVAHSNPSGAEKAARVAGTGFKAVSSYLSKKK